MDKLERAVLMILNNRRNQGRGAPLDTNHLQLAIEKNLYEIEPKYLNFKDDEVTNHILKTTVNSLAGRQFIDTRGGLGTTKVLILGITDKGVAYLREGMKGAFQQILEDKKYLLTTVIAVLALAISIIVAIIK